jgi:hypothetical protein
MSRTFIVGLTAAFILAASPSAQAQGPGGGGRMIGDAAAKALVERRIDVIKTALSLTPEQQKLWPAVEDAIRARAATRHERLSKLIARRNGQDDLNPIDAMRARADALTQKAAGLKKLADAWQPLYASLDDNQKQRLAFLAAYAVRELRDAVASRLMAADEEYDDGEDDEY